MVDPKLIDRLAEASVDVLHETFAAFLGAGDDTFESPIEALLCGAFLLIGKMSTPRALILHRSDRPTSDVQCFEELQRRWWGPHVDAIIVPQVTIDPWRVDFFATTFGGGGRPFGIVVECDGHDFHERTRQQAAHDRSRDRDLQSRGYKVLRFTGSEIWKDPMGCADEVRLALEDAFVQWLEAPGEAA